MVFIGVIATMSTHAFLKASATTDLAVAVKLGIRGCGVLGADCVVL
jgi:hypothetical protein